MADLPPVLAGAIAFAAYVLVVGILWRVGRVDYLRMVESDGTVVRALIVPIGAGLVLLAGLTTALGWWPDVLSQARTGPAWALAVPALFLVLSAISIARVDFSALGSRRTVLLAVGTAIVGAAEELLARGLLVVAAQHAGWSLTSAWLFSTALFALLHAINVLVGMPWTAMIGQLVLSFFGGTVLFVTLMTTGSLLVAVVLHALWDFVTLAHQGGGTTTPRVAGAGLLVLYVLGAVAVVFVLTA
ncbi:CPBP family intramembrane glutamic endopeptidase [Demequina rhizosphaerae]|uniref:CPBP family intramembrane glutamic endopeptidase n=1 Tax=Demequina rhizosphaerae TaxID=1638985 RepID=UPI000786628F|nr:CPBP family intramembrane glutamic endopeptidase [Demequina rhizosphaerae]